MTSTQTSSLHVLHIVATDHRRGGELFAADLVSALNEFGLRQHVAVLRGSRALDVSFQAPVSTMRPGREIPAIRVSARRIVDLARLVRRLRPDVIQAHGGEPLKYAIAASPRSPVPIVYRRIGSIHGWTKPGLRRSGHAMLMKRATRVITLGLEMHRETVETLGVPADHVVVIPNAIDPQRIRASASAAATREMLGISEGVPLILWIGALSDEKDPLAVPAIAEMIGSEGAVFALVGDGPLAGRLRATIDRMGLRDRVRLLGARTDVGNLLESCELMLVTSRTEGVPGVVIEAGMHGVPVVSYDVGGIREVVVQGETGILAAAGDRRALAASLRRALRDVELRARLGSAAQTRCSSAFDIRSISQSYLKVYEEVARERAVVAVPSDRA